MLNDLANRALRASIQVMGEPITYARGEQSWAIKAMYQDAYIGADPETGGPVSTVQPVAGIDARDLPITPRKGDAVTARGETFRVRDARPDGHTGFTLFLHKVS
jgi:hypothetical protein